MNTRDERLRAYFQRAEEIIAKVGWLVQGVFPTEDDEGLSFAYTVGLHDQGLPELLTFSLPPNVAQSLLNDVARYLVKAKATGMAQTGQITHDNWPMPFYLAPARAPEASEYATFARNRSQEQATYLQVVWPDRGGRFPWEEGALDSTKPLQPTLYDAPASA